MPKPTLFKTLVAAAVGAVCAAALLPVDAGIATAAPPDTTGGIRVPLTTSMRACDYTMLMVKPYWGAMQAGQGEAVIRINGNSVVVDVQFTNSRELGTHYDVGLIQVPRSSASPCGPGSPGTAYTGMDVDASGRASATIHDTLRSGTTGVWVKIMRPSPRSQDPVEYYSSSFLAKV